MTSTTNDPTELRRRAEALRLHGLLAHWDQAVHSPWLPSLLDWEEAERGRRSRERRLRRAHIGTFKPLVDFDWSWPTKCDRAAIEELMRLEFLAEASNVVLFGPNGIGKSTIAKNIAQHALDCGHTVHVANAGELLGDLAALDSASTRNRRLRHYASFDVLAIDEVGYLSYSNRHADLLFELTNRRYEKKSTIVTTNQKCAAAHLAENSLLGVAAPESR